MRRHALMVPLATAVLAAGPAELAAQQTQEVDRAELGRSTAAADRADDDAIVISTATLIIALLILIIVLVA